MEIDLSNYYENDCKFAENSKKFSLSKKINFIFGKNGTGKSTIKEAIRNKYGEEYNVCIFEGYEGVVGENHRLDAIALGRENAEIQKKIEEVDKEIDDIKKEIDEPTDESKNLFTKNKKTNEDYKAQEDKIENFYTQSASKIKNQTNPQIAKTNYDKTYFKGEIENAKFLSDEEMKRHKATMRAEQKKAVNAIPFPDIDLAEQLKITNEILIKKVEQQQIISELQNSPSKQNFAREGLKIHEHKDGEKCGFCGNEISEERWILLEKYFNEEVKNFEDTIKTVIDKLDEKNSTLDNMPEIDERLFYEQFSEKIKSLTSQIKNIKNDYKTFLNSLKTALEEKKREIFSASTELTFSIPQNFDVVKNEYEKIVDENNIFSQNLQTEQENAKNTLRLHEVKVALEEFKYDVEKNTLDKLESQKNETQKELNEKKQESEIKKTVKKGLIDQTKDRSKLAIEINNLLKTMGVLSFSLELVSDSEGQKGQYQIKGHNNDIRTIDKLSKGEKNIIAFLYFIFSIEAPTEDTKPKLIIFDDPMTSNDDTMQYLMTEQIRKLYSKINNSKSDYFILLTHNLHFYLNVRPNYNEVEENKILQRNRRQSDDSQKEKTFYEKSGYFILKNNGTHTTIQSIEDYNMDHKTSYSALWNDLIFLYNNDKPVSMLNNCRRIIETYIKFNKIEKKFYENNEFVRKLFNVNSHSIDDQENELNGKTKDEIKIMLHEAFKKNNVEDHFKAYWILSSNQEDDE